MALLGQHLDSWGRASDGCEVARGLGRTTWSLCRKEKVAIGVYGDGKERFLCQPHLAGALRKTVFYADEIVEVRTLEGVTTHKLERTTGRRGYMKAAA